MLLVTIRNISLTGQDLGCILRESQGINPMTQSNIQATKDPAWELYLTLSDLAGKESIMHNNHPVDSVDWHTQNARQEAYHAAAMLALKSIKLAC